jgi:hypothetical protein
MRVLRPIIETATGFPYVRHSQVLQGGAAGLELVGYQDTRVTMPRHGFPEDLHCGFSIPALGHKGFQDFAFVIDGPPEVVGDTIDFCGNPIQMPPPVGQGPHSVDPLAADLGGEHRAEAVPPEPHGLMADVDAALLQHVFDVAQRERLTDGHHHGKTDDFRASLEVLEWGCLVISAG